ncbi:MAG: outer membrane beta-barrel protein [Flavobacteriales bacterium]|nr:outer membrane beta-barrel protein [Flavobacteriales bacterium]
MTTKNLFHLFAASVAACCINVSTQAQAFEQGTSALNLGVGIGGVGYGYLSGLSNVSASPTFNASYELGVAKLGPDVLGVGAMFGHSWRTQKYTSQTTSYTYNYDRRWTTTTVGVRAHYHFNWFHSIEKLDLYAGVFTGASFGAYKNKDTRTSRSTGVTEDWSSYGGSYGVGGFRSGVFAGARYYFSDNFGVFGEVGYSVAYLNAGLTLKF